MNDGVFVQESPGKGRGVFAGCHFVPGEVVVTSHVVEMGREDLPALLSTAMRDYWWHWPCTGGAAFALGPASLVNHAEYLGANVLARKDPARRLLLLIATEPIGPGDEVLLDYGTA
jgi:hypothetical protein